MGRKKRRAQAELPPAEYKKAKLYKDDGALSAAGALFEYAQRMRLGRVGYRVLSQDPWVVSCVVNESDMCTVKAGTKVAALEKAARVTMHFLDPTAKSICANLPIRDEGMLDKLRRDIESADSKEAAKEPAGQRLVFSEQAMSMEERRAMLPRYQSPVKTGGKPVVPITVAARAPAHTAAAAGATAGVMDLELSIEARLAQFLQK